MPTPSLHGVIPALVTPFHEDESVDFGAWQTIIDLQIMAGVDAVFAGGSQGEFFSMDFAERLAALRFCRRAVSGRVPLLGNVGCITTRDTVRLAQQAEAAGVDAIVVVTPYYIKPSPDELFAHYVEVCRSVRLPVLAYNFPLHGGVNLAAETLGAIGATCENLVGVKDSSGMLELAVTYRTCVPGRELAVFVGPDQLVLRALDQGCAGAITGCVNVAPRLFVELYRAFREGRHAEAERLQLLADLLGAAHGLHTFPSVMKEAMKMTGVPAGICRKPVSPLPEAARRRLAQVIDILNAAGLLACTASQ